MVMRTRLLSAVLVGVAAPISATSAATVQAPPGFAACAACHTTSKDGANGMGPNLRGVVGRKAATVPGFKYSAAMTKSGVTWSAAELDTFLTAPRKRVPNTSMAYFGISDPAKRKAIISYLGTLK